MAVSVLGLAGPAQRQKPLRPFRPDSARGDQAQRELGRDGAGSACRRPPLLRARAMAIPVARTASHVSGSGFSALALDWAWAWTLDRAAPFCPETQSLPT